MLRYGNFFRYFKSWREKLVYDGSHSQRPQRKAETVFRKDSEKVTNILICTRENPEKHVRSPRPKQGALHARRVRQGGHRMKQTETVASDYSCSCDETQQFTLLLVIYHR